MKKLLLSLLTIHCSLLTLAQPAKTYTSSEILLNLKKLNVLGSVLYVAAHPDDENTRLLAYLANEKLMRTGYLSITRGDGGQNLIGDEQGIDLGLIRTQELLAARRIDGAEQFFTRAYDFGYSKSPDETMRIWGHDKILSDVVWVIRKFKPDVIIARFPTTGEGGHGHHTASGILAGEAFDAAADPTKFPEQLKQGVDVWQAKRLLWNTFNFGNTNTQNENQFKMDVGAFNPLLGKSYGEIAALSRSQHKSQGFGVPSQRGTQIEYFKTLKGTAPVTDLFDGVDVNWSRTPVNNLDSAIINQLKTNIEIIIAEFNHQHPEKSVPDLVAVAKQLQSVPDEYWKKQKLAEIQKLIEACAGLYLEASTGTQYAVQGDSLKINFTANSRSFDNVSFIHAKVLGNHFNRAEALTKNKNLGFSKTILIKDDEPLTQPYWLENEKEEGAFTVNNQQQIGLAENGKNVAEFAVNINGQDFIFNKPLQYKHTDPVKGEIFQPVSLVPSFTGKFLPEVDAIDITNQKTKNFNSRKQVVLYSFKDNNPVKTISKSIGAYTIGGGKVETTLNKDQKKTFDVIEPLFDFPLDENGKQIRGNFSFEDYMLDSYCYPNGSRILESRQIKYDHIPALLYFKKARFTKYAAQDLKTTGSTIGYIPGAGDKVPEALEQMGYKVVTLSEADITKENIKSLDAIVTGVRAYNTNEWMNNVYEVLMSYVKDGGTLLVQYNTSNQIGPVKAKISPYPFTISRNRITDENTKVNFLLPDHPVLNYPNKITEKDFEGWVQERSIYHAEAMDSNYQRIFSMKDPDDKVPHDGSLIVANYGKGKFVYTGLVFFRQLPAGVPGAYRLFANLISRNEEKSKGKVQKQKPQAVKPVMKKKK